MSNAITARIEKTFKAYPRQFWVLFFGTLINSTGSGLVYPFFSLYLTRLLNFSMTEVGFIYTCYALMSIASQGIGGSLSDRWGRKPVMLVGMLGSAAGALMLAMGSTIHFTLPWMRWGWVAMVVVVMGLTSSSFIPAVNAMIADLLDSRQRPNAYGLLRVMQNLGLALGPAVGGIIAVFSYFVLFLAASVTSLIYVLILFFLTRETRPQQLHAAQVSPKEQRSSWKLSEDKIFMAFCILAFFSQLVYCQYDTTLPVFLNRELGVAVNWYGWMMSMSALLVVLLQFPITFWISRYNKPAMLALGSGLYAIGFGMFGFVSRLPLLFLAQATWTVGEMVTVPVASAFIADLAPETRRGSYMGVYGMALAIGYGLGPLMAGAAMDRVGGRSIWYAAIVIETLVVMGYLALRRVFPDRQKSEA